MWALSTNMSTIEKYEVWFMWAVSMEDSMRSLRWIMYSIVYGGKKFFGYSGVSFIKFLVVASKCKSKKEMNTSFSLYPICILNQRSFCSC